MSDSPVEARPWYQYHLVRNALERFSKRLVELDESQLAEVRSQADQTYALESLVLESDEAADVLVSEEELDAAVAEVASRYPGPRELRSDLGANGLSEALLRQALHRELRFDRVMRRVAARQQAVTDAEARRYYESHPNRFVVPEQRAARQILITVNDALPENRRPVARARLEAIAAEVKRNPELFPKYAYRYSECPSALRGGELGNIRRGQLYAVLESALFTIAEGSVSELIETPVGFHLLLHEKLIPARKIPFSSAQARIQRALEARQQRKAHRAFIEGLAASSPRRMARLWTQT